MRSESTGWLKYTNIQVDEGNVLGYRQPSTKGSTLQSSQLLLFVISNELRSKALAREMSTAPKAEPFVEGCRFLLRPSSLGHDSTFARTRVRRE
jgi:hypothetical protein